MENINKYYPELIEYYLDNEGNIYNSKNRKVTISVSKDRPHVRLMLKDNKKYKTYDLLEIIFTIKYKNSKPLDTLAVLDGNYMNYHPNNIVSLSKKEERLLYYKYNPLPNNHIVNAIDLFPMLLDKDNIKDYLTKERDFNMYLNGFDNRYIISTIGSIFDLHINRYLQFKKNVTNNTGSVVLYKPNNERVLLSVNRLLFETMYDIKLSDDEIVMLDGELSVYNLRVLKQDFNKKIVKKKVSIWSFISRLFK